MAHAPRDKFLRVKNWARFQHYRKRRPPWIKLYADLLRDHAFSCLSDASKWAVVGMFLLASRHENRIPFDKSWIRSELGCKRMPDFTAIFASGLIEVCGQDASEVLHTKTEAETDVQAEIKKSPLALTGKSANDGGVSADKAGRRLAGFRPVGEEARRMAGELRGRPEDAGASAEG